jgi:hypothetical protein
MATRADGFTLASRVVKGLAIVLGGACTFVSFASVVGLVTGNAWARAIGALVLSVALPAVAVDRALPKTDSGKPRAGLVADVVALTFLGVALLFVGLGQPVTRPLLVREGDRLAEDGHEVPAHVVYLMAGVRPVDSITPEPPPAPASATPSAPAPGSSSAPSAPAPGSSSAPAPGSSSAPSAPSTSASGK